MATNLWLRLLPVAFLVAFTNLSLAQTSPAAKAVTPVAAQSSTPAPAATAITTGDRRKDAQALLDTLTDDKSRNELVARLRALVETQDVKADPAEGRDDWLASATRSLGGVSRSILAFVGELERLPELAQRAITDLSDPAGFELLARVGTTITAVLAAALVVEWLTNWLLVRPRKAIEVRATANILLRLFLLCVRTVIDVLPIMAFAAATYGVLAMVELSFLVRLTVVTLVNANLLSRIVIAAGRAILSPGAPGLRLFRMENESAAYGFLWVRWFTHATVYGYFLLRAGWLVGLSATSFTFLSNILALFIAGMIVVFILQIRAGVSRQLRGRSSASGSIAGLRRKIAEFWHVLVIAYVAAVYVVWVMNLQGGFAYLARATLMSALTIVIGRLAMVGLVRMFGALFSLGEELRTEYPRLEARASRYLPILRQVLQGVIVAICVLAFMEIWGGEPFEWFASTGGQRLLGRFVSIAVVMLATLVAWEVGTAFGERLALRNPTSTRMNTLLPFLQNAFRIVLMTIVSLIVLSEIGVNIAPLLAGAGVFGLALGFGAQTLVKDVITGIFILMENTIAIGDVVEVGTHSGLVEKMSIRTVHLRDFDGNVHSIPFGEVQTVKNMSKIFAYAVVDVTVAYRENIDDALAVMAEVAAGMVASGPLSETIIAPFEVVGVEGLQDSAVWLRGRFKTRPLGQWNVRREFYRRIKAAFDERGIEIPYPHRTLYFGVDKKGDAPALNVVNEAAAASRARKSKPKRATASVETTGPLIEEHPGARERIEADDDALPEVEKPSP
ncbi:hypothetical protein BH11PSE4_BH11PSE4_19830 [soil metagenome]